MINDPVTTPTAQAHRDAGPTELAARRKAARTAGSLRGRVLAAVAAAGNDGLTVLEALELLNLHERRRYSVAPRFSDLLREGYVEKTTESRDGFVSYTATPAGLEWAQKAVAA